jgi:hypothetical protein
MSCLHVSLEVDINVARMILHKVVQKIYLARTPYTMQHQCDLLDELIALHEILTLLNVMSPPTPSRQVGFGWFGLRKGFVSGNRTGQTIHRLW